jgi:hypothetical protein
MRAKLRGVWVLSAVGWILLAGIAVAVAAVLMRGAGDDSGDRQRLLEMAGAEFLTRAPTIFAEGGGPGVPPDLRHALLQWDELEEEMGWPLLRTEHEDFRHQPFWRAVLSSGSVPYVVDTYTTPNSDDVVLWQQAGPNDRSQQFDARGAIDERIGRFDTRVIDNERMLRARFATGALAGSVPVIAIVDAPDMETLVRFIESLSFGDDAAD